MFNVSSYAETKSLKPETVDRDATWAVPSPVVSGRRSYLRLDTQPVFLYKISRERA